ncbi:hypothetical protein ABVT39_013226, partial [Epinephelus coioides]
MLIHGTILIIILVINSCQKSDNIQDYCCAFVLSGDNSVLLCTSEQSLHTLCERPECDATDGWKYESVLNYSKWHLTFAEHPSVICKRYGYRVLQYASAAFMSQQIFLMLNSSELQSRKKNIHDNLFQYYRSCGNYNILSTLKRQWFLRQLLMDEQMTNQRRNGRAPEILRRHPFPQGGMEKQKSFN